MGEYDSAIALARRLIAKKGTLVTLRNFTTAAAPDADKPWYPGGSTPVNQTVRAVFLNYEQKYIDGEKIQAGDQRVFMSAADTSEVAIVPTLEALVVRGSELWKVVHIEPLKPADDQVMWTLQVRQ